MHISTLPLLLGLATLLATYLGGRLALYKKDSLHLILAFSAGAVLGVAFFDLLPEALELATREGFYSGRTVTLTVAIGFLLFMVLSNTFLLHPHSEQECSNEQHQRLGALGAASLSLHSLLDGISIGLAFQVSPSVGWVVAAAVLAHDFSDGINTVSLVLKNNGDIRQAYRWLIADAVAPLVGIVSTFFFHLPEAQLGLVLSLFCGFFLYIGASDLLPESHHDHNSGLTTLMTLLGAAIIFLAIHLAS